MKRRRPSLRSVLRRWGPWTALGVFVAALVAGAGATGLGVKRVHGSSEYCASCHEDRAGEEHLHGHTDVACQDCHTVPDEDTLRFVWAHVDRNVALPSHGAVDEQTCERCHAADDDAWAALVDTAGHASHASGPNALTCVSCHGASLHGEPAPAESCLGCHQDVPLESEPRAEQDCVTCHTFRVPSLEDGAPASHGQTWASLVDIDQVHGAADCRLCHNPHEPEPQTAPDCTSCHRGDIAATAAMGPEAHQQGSCTGCHGVHSERDALATLCVGCHAQPDMGVVASRPASEEPDVGASPHLVSTALVAAAPLSPAELEERTHQGQCATCHEPHAFTPDRRGCFGCHAHEDEVASLAALPAGSHQECVGCHDPHAAPPGGDTCRQCHADKPVGRNVPGQHRDCLSCHSPHDARPTFAEACSSACHEGPRRSLRTGPERHRDCGSCHTPHGDPTRGAQTACVQCHQTQAASVARQGQHQQCVSCHVPHDLARTAATNRCGSCHAATTAPGTAHQGQCSSCHAIHGRESPADSCANCHETRLDVARHQCAGCHQPHQPAARARTECASCHQDVTRAARTWPAGSPHAGQCMDCHTKHDVQRQASCASCHAQQARPAHTGSHESCTNCHAPHRAAPASTAGWWNRCAECHQDEARLAATATRPQHRSCSNCHDRPQRQAPTCESCHQMQRVGLHAVAEHRNQCTDCHSQHGTREPRPRECLACHTEMTNHNPEARECHTCHIFSQ